MSNPNYTLEIISHHPQFKNRSLRKYYVDGIETIGAWGDEPFEIQFKNHTYQKVQVKISLDGTDILTGKPATTEVNNDMWVVNGYGTLNLKAWPETSNGGASFIFTSANNSVAVHTHGDLSSRGIIAAAVYTESHVPPTPVRVEQHHHYHRQNPYYYSLGGPIWYNGNLDITCGDSINNSGSLTYDSGSTISFNASNNSIQSATTITDCSNAASQTLSRRRSKSLESLVSVGAGQHVDQKISYVAGLVKPSFTETVRVRYLWWDDLVSKLREENVPAPHASGFPGDKNRQVMSLGTTPRISNYDKAFPRKAVAQEYLRV